MIYLDASPITAILLGEKGYMNLKKLLRGGQVFSAILLEAEVLSALHRENVSALHFAEFSDALTWLHPSRPLTHEIKEALSYGYLRGTDLLHVATAIYAFHIRTSVHFFSLDRGQRKVAAACGFKLLPQRL